MPDDPLRKWLGENRRLFIDGYFTDRITKGDFPDNREPRTSLPKIPAGASMEVKTGYLATLRAEEEKKLQKK